MNKKIKPLFDSKQFYSDKIAKDIDVDIQSSKPQKCSVYSAVERTLNSSYGVFIIKEDKICDVNDIFTDLLGFHKNDLIERGSNDISFVANPTKYSESNALMEKGDINEFEIVVGYYKVDGQILWSKTRIVAIRDDNGYLKAKTFIVDDLTQNYSENLGISTLNSITSAIIGKDDVKEIAWIICSKIATYLNTNDCVIYLLDETGKKLEQIAASTNKSNGSKIVHNKISIPVGRGIVGSVALTGKSEVIDDTSEDVRYIIDDEFRLSEITVPIMHDGQTIGIIDAEHERSNYFDKHHLRTLESIASVVGLQLKSVLDIQNLKKAQKKNKLLLQNLEQRNQELQEYAHVVSHDLKSPLRSISALVSWLKTDNHGNFDENSLQYFQDIEETLEGMENLISNILEYSSVREQNEEIKVERIDLHRTVEAIIKLLQPPNNISIKINNKLPVVFGDVVKFKQIFQNLLSNAIKYNDKENGKIIVECKEWKSFYEFSVKDNGMGIEEKYYTKIFKIFQSLKNDKNSTGVGLSIVQKIIEQYGGKIWVTSKVGEGTTFYFTVKK